MIVAAHQPLFIPWVGYFDKINKSDLFVIVDNVQFTTSGWIRRNSIKGPSGEQKLIVPIKQKKRVGQLISDVCIDNEMNRKWREKHLNTFKCNYGRAPYYSEVMTELEKIYSTDWERLFEFNLKLIKSICDYIGITTKIILSSESNIQGGKTELIIDICQKTGADKFILGMGGSAQYANRELIESKGVNLISQNFKHPEYKQLSGDFIPNLSILDMLFNMGKKTMDIIGARS